MGPLLKSCHILWNCDKISPSQQHKVINISWCWLASCTLFDEQGKCELSCKLCFLLCIYHKSQGCYMISYSENTKNQYHSFWLEMAKLSPKNLKFLHCSAVLDYAPLCLLLGWYKGFKVTFLSWSVSAVWQCLSMSKWLRWSVELNKLRFTVHRKFQHQASGLTLKESKVSWK